MDIGFGDALDGVGSDGEVGGGELGVVVERALVEEDCGHRVGGGVGGFELTGERLDSRDFGLLDLCFGWRLGLDAFEFEHELLGCGSGDVGFDEATGVEGTAFTIGCEDGVCAVGEAVDFAEVHVDAAGEGSAENVVHDLEGLQIGSCDGDTEAIDDEGGLGCAGFVDECDAKGWGSRRGGDGDVGCCASGPCAEVVFGEALGFFDGDVAGEDEGGIRGAVVFGIEAGDVVASETANAFEGADGRLAVGLVAEEQAWADATGGCDGGVGLLGDADEPLFTDAFEVVGVEGWV